MTYKFEKKRLYGLLGKSLVETLKTYKCFLGGGAITSLFCNRDINDFDIYFRSEKDLISFVYDIWGSENWVVSSTGKATCIKLHGKDVQMIHFRYFNSAQEIFETFDFTACMGAFDFGIEEFVLHDDFLRHNSQRILNFNPDTAFPIVSLLRVAKYQDRGYHISKTELVKIALTCMNLDIDNFDDLKDQLGGMYGVNYDKMFEEIKDEEFSLEKAIDYISELAHDDKYYEAPEPMEFHSAEELLSRIVDDLGIKYFTLKNKYGRPRYYSIMPDGDIESSNQQPEDYEEISVMEYLKSNKLYKFVKKISENKYSSIYDENYFYEIGKEAKPKNDYLFFNTKDKIDESPYYNRNDAVCIEVEFDEDDVAELGCYRQEFKLRKCRVIREVPESEWRSENNGDDSLPF